MLTDFLDELKKALNKRRSDLVDDLIANGDPLTRGQIQGIDAAFEELSDVVADFLDVEEAAA